VLPQHEVPDGHTVSDACTRPVSEEPAPFRTVYEENVATVYSFLRARVGHDAAEDLTAETFCRAFQHYGGWEDRGLPVRAWLLRIAFHLVVGESRKRKVDFVALEEHHAVDEEGASGAVAQAMEGASALAALAGLPENHRSVIQLRYLQDLSVAETAAVMGLTQEGVRALAYRALKGLRVAHADMWGDPARASGARPEAR
jgi:RNA polymerase sigma factor (sigma-70 family)